MYRYLILSTFLLLFSSTAVAGIPPTKYLEDGSAACVGCFIVDCQDNLTCTKNGNTIEIDATGGDVSAAANITDNAIVRGDGGAKGIQESGCTIDDSNNVTCPGDITLTESVINQTGSITVDSVGNANQTVDRGGTSLSRQAVFRWLTAGTVQFTGGLHTTTDTWDLQDESGNSMFFCTDSTAVGNCDISGTLTLGTGNNTISNAAGQLDMTKAADADLGEIGTSSGVWTVENDAIDSQHYAAGSIDNEHLAVNSLDSDNYIDGSIDAEHHAADSITHTQIADADQQTSFGIVIETPVDADDLLFYRANEAFTVTSIDCIVEDATSAVVVIVECDSAGDNCGTSRMSESLTCDVDGATDDGTIGEAAIAAGGWFRAQVGTVTGTPGHVAVTVSGTWDD